MPNPRRSKAVKVKPVKAWAVHLHGQILISSIRRTKKRVELPDFFGSFIIPVLIVPIRPKAGRRKK